MGGLLRFPSAAEPDACIACGRGLLTHVDAQGRWMGCTRDVVLGQDQMTLARRLRLARLQTRPLKVRPFAIDVEES